MIHPYDDLPLHQSSAPLLHPTSDSAGLYDRYFFNGFDRNGEVFFAVALGVYPNRQVMDASFSVVVDGVQHNCRSSRRCSSDRTVTTAGSIDVQVVEPMLRHRIVIDDHHGISADLTMQVVSPVIEEPTFVRRVEGRVVMDYTRITQFVEWSGWIDLDGTRIALDELGVVEGCRDRSWGIRGGSRGLPGPAVPPQFFWTWAPTLFDDMCTHLAVNDDAEGRSWHKSAAVTKRFTVGSHTIDDVTSAGGRSPRIDVNRYFLAARNSMGAVDDSNDRDRHGRASCCELRAGAAVSDERTRLPSPRVGPWRLAR